MSNPKLTLFHKLKALPQLGSQDVVCLNLSGNSLKLAYAKVSPARKEVVSLASCGIQGLSDDDISKVIWTSLNNLKIKKPDVITIIPLYLAITKNIEIPSQDQQEIKEIIDLQGSKHTPYSRDEIIIDYLNLGTYKKNYTKILLIIVTLSVIRRQLEILKVAGLKAEKVFFAPECMTKGCFKALKCEPQDDTQTLLHVDTNYTDFIIASKKKSIFTRSIPIGVQHLLNEKERYQIRFVEEVKKSLEAYASEGIDKVPNDIILTGATEGMADSTDMLMEKLGSPIRIFSYLDNAAISADALKDARSFKGISFLDVIAPLLTHDQHMDVNLIPEEIKLKKQFEEKSKDLVKTGIFVMICFGLICGILICNIYFKAAYLKKLTQKYQPITQAARGLESDFSKIQAVRYYLNGRGLALNVLTEIYNLISPDIRLNEIKFNPPDRFSIIGNSRTMASVFSFIGSIEESKYFKNAEARRTTKRKEGNEELVDFEIICSLEEAK